MTTPVYTYLQLIKSVLEEIRTSKGYETDLGAMVTLEPTQQLGDGGQRIVLLQTQYGPPATAGLRHHARAIGFHVIAQVSRNYNDAQLRLHRAGRGLGLPRDLAEPVPVGLPARPGDLDGALELAHHPIGLLRGLHVLADRAGEVSEGGKCP